MQSGYVKLWRKSIENGWLQNSKLWAFWCYCLIKASHKEITMTVGLQRIQLKPGQFVFGRTKASKDLKINESSIYRLVKFLENSGNIEVKSNNKFSIITIINWGIYQGESTTSEQQMNNKRTTNEHKQECKALKNKEYSVSFLEFYSSYPLKKEKKKAYKRWQTLKKQNQLPPIDIILSAITKQKLWRKNANGGFRPEWKHPATWLNAGCWEDEINTTTKKILTGDEALYHEG